MTRTHDDRYDIIGLSISPEPLFGIGGIEAILTSKNPSGLGPGFIVPYTHRLPPLDFTLYEKYMHRYTNRPSKRERQGQLYGPSHKKCNIDVTENT